MSSKSPSRKKLTSAQLSVLYAAWGKGMHNMQSHLVQQVQRETGLGECRIKDWILNRNQSLRSMVAKSRKSILRKCTGYQLFCSSLTNTNIADFGAKWRALPKCEQKLWQDRAFHKNMMPVELKDKKDKAMLRRKALKSLNAACALLQQCDTTVAGMVIFNSEMEVFGCDKGKEFLKKRISMRLDFINHMHDSTDIQLKNNTAHLRRRVRRMFNSKYTEACGASEEQKMPYTKLHTVRAEGLPDGIKLKDPNLYGCKMCKRIIDVEDDIKFHILSAVSSPSPSTKYSPFVLEVLHSDDSEN